MIYSTNTTKPFLLSQIYSLSLVSYRCGVIYIIFENNLGLYGDALFGSNCVFQHFICDILACYKDKKKKKILNKSNFQYWYINIGFWVLLKLFIPVNLQVVANFCTQFIVSFQWCSCMLGKCLIYLPLNLVCWHPNSVTSFEQVRLCIGSQ